MCLPKRKVSQPVFQSCAFSGVMLVSGRGIHYQHIPSPLTSALIPSRPGLQLPNFFVAPGAVEEMGSEKKKEALHPWKLTWNLKITQLKRNIIFKTSILGFQMLIFLGYIGNLGPSDVAQLQRCLVKHRGLELQGIHISTGETSDQIRFWGYSVLP